MLRLVQVRVPCRPCCLYILEVVIWVTVYVIKLKTWNITEHLASEGELWGLFGRKPIGFSW